MALLMMEGFDHVAVSDMPKKGWSAAFNVSYVGRYGQGQCMTYGGGADSKVFKNLKANSTDTVYVNVAWSLVDLASKVLVVLRDGTTDQVSIYYDHATLTLKAYRGDDTGTLLGTSSAITTAIDTWYLLEVKVVFSSTVGEVVIKHNGTEILNATALNTMASANAYINKLGFKNLFFAVTPRFDDVVVVDSSGTDNNTWIGDCRITTLFPDADGANSDFTPSAGTSHYDLVYETTPDLGDYVYSNVVGDKDTYSFDNMPTNAVVKGVQLNILAKKDDAGSRSVAPVIRHGATDYDGTSVALGATEAYVSEIFEVNPGTSAAFTPSDVNAAEFGVKVSA